MPSLNRFVLPAVLILCSVTAMAQDILPTVPPAQTQNGIRYVTGGVGEDESHAMLAEAHSYSLRMLFAGPAGEYLSDVDVTISSLKDERLLHVRTEGPFLYASLPAGTYRIDATAGRAHVTRQVAIGKHGSSLTVHLDPAGPATAGHPCASCPRVPAN